MNTIDLTVIILTYQEEANIKYALQNVSEWAKQIIVLDSFSTDNTIAIIKQFNAEIYQREFDNYANQRNYALRELNIQNSWTLFLDADEWLTDELKNEITQILKNPKCDGYLIKRRFYFMERWIKYGGYYPSWNLRLFKHYLASVNREINEHIEVSGKVGRLKYDMIDENHKGFSDWINKHNKYSDFESKQFDLAVHDNMAKLWGSPIERKRWIRLKVWNKILPPLIRPFIYFLYRYFLRLGFLDGRAGFIYHFMHGLVYRLIIDIKYIENKRQNSKQ